MYYEFPATFDDFACAIIANCDGMTAALADPLFADLNIEASPEDVERIVLFLMAAHVVQDLAANPDIEGMSLDCLARRAACSAQARVKDILHRTRHSTDAPHEQN